LLLVLVAAGLALGGCTSFSSQRADPAPATIGFRGELSHNWLGPVTATCDFTFQLYDAELNGTPLGPAVVADAVPVRGGQLRIDVQSTALDPPQAANAPGWLAVGVRCPGAGQAYEVFGPRLQHHRVPSPGQPSGEWVVPAGASGLLCTLPVGQLAAHPSGPPTLHSAVYRLRGGFEQVT
jgi:hypothetical protein